MAALKCIKNCEDLGITGGNVGHGLRRGEGLYQFFKTQVTFAGFQLSLSGYKVDPSITDAITKYPMPTTRSDLRSFMGIVNQKSTSTHTLAALLTPLRPLLSTKNKFLWSSHHQEAFTKTSLTDQR